MLKSFSSLAEENAYSHLLPVAEHFDPLLKLSLAISDLLISLPSVIPLVILFVNHMRKLGILLSGLLPVPLHSIILHLWLLSHSLFLLFTLYYH